MAGERDLDKLLASLSPRLMDDDFVFCTIKEATYGDFADLSPLASFSEDEGLTLVNDARADLRAGIEGARDSLDNALKSATSRFK